MVLNFSSISAQDLSRSGGSFCGKVRANFMGTKFVAYNHGAKPGSTVADIHSAPLQRSRASLYLAATSKLTSASQWDTQLHDPPFWCTWPALPRMHCIEGCDM